MDLKDAMQPGYNEGLVNLGEDIAELELSAGGVKFLGERNQKPQSRGRHLLDSGEVDEDSQAGTPLKEGSQLLADVSDAVLVNNPPISKLHHQDVVLERNNQTRELFGHPKPFGTPRRVQKEAVNVLSR